MSSTPAQHFVVVGLGSIGRRHASNLAELYPDARFTFVRHGGGADEFTERLGGRVVTDLADALDEGVDLAVLATPSANHIDALPALIRSSCPLLVEKPIVAELADCDRVVAELRDAAPAVRAAGFNLRHLPSLQRMHGYVRGGDLGPVARASFIAGQWLPDWRPGTDYRASYSADAARGGGVELDLSHEFDVARWFFGDLDVEFARGAHLTALDLRAHDTSVSVLSPRGGRGPIVTIALDYVSRRRVRWYEVVAERGRVQWSLDGQLELATDAGAQSEELGAGAYDVGASYVDMLRNLMRSIAGDDTATTQSLEDGLSSTRLALEVRDRGGSA